MVCYICRKEIVGAYIEEEKNHRCRHIECKQEVVFASSVLNIKPRDLKKYRTDMTIDDPDLVIMENIIGDVDE